jgi:hypothetical protein
LQVSREPLEKRRAARIGQSQALCQSGIHLGGLAHGGEIHKPGAVAEVVAESLFRLKGETGLADSRRTGQGEQPGPAADQQLANQLQLLRAAQEARLVCLVAVREDVGRRHSLSHLRSGFEQGHTALVAVRTPVCTHIPWFRVSRFGLWVGSFSL